MQYRTDRYGNPISVLGYGCMRFTQTAGKIDIAKTEKEILEAFHGGVNYFDTAYIYPGSEAALGEILARNGIREQVNIATKLPHYLLKKPEDLDRCFSEELRRLKTDHVDYYLMHMLTDTKTWQRLEGLGIVQWLAEKKASGQIRQVGFSYHGNSDMFCKLLDIYDWDFCQIQYNYLDENSQAGATGLHRAAEKGLPVIIMEPLRGGRLTNALPASAKKIIEPTSLTPAQFAFRWLWDQKEATCVLSGMNSLDMVKENLATAQVSHPDSLTPEDRGVYTKVVAAINENMKVGCTGCRYCMPCPMGVDIPDNFSIWNKLGMFGQPEAIKHQWEARFPDAEKASHCVRCGKCEAACPQHLPIRNALAQLQQELDQL